MSPSVSKIGVFTLILSTSSFFLYHSIHNTFILIILNLPTLSVFFLNNSICTSLWIWELWMALSDWLLGIPSNSSLLVHSLPDVLTLLIYHGKSPWMMLTSGNLGFLRYRVQNIVIKKYHLVIMSLLYHQLSWKHLLYPPLSCPKNTQPKNIGLVCLRYSTIYDISDSV